MSDHVLDLLTGGWKARAVASATRSGVFDALCREPADSVELAHRLDLHQPTLDRLLRLLVAVDLLATDPDGTHRLTDAGAVLVSDHPSSLRRLAELYEEQYFDSAWRQFGTGLRTGESPFAAAFGEPVFDYLDEHAQEASRYTAAIGEGAPHGRVLAAAAGLGAPRHIVDVGGGDGRMLTGLLEVHADARGTLLDRPDVARRATAAFDRAGIADRAVAVGGDFFTDMPEGADVYVLSRVLHNWNDETCLSLLRAIRRASGPDARVLIVERMLRDNPLNCHGDTLASLFDLHMFVMTEGRERTESEYASMASAVGFRPRPALPLVLGFSVLIAGPCGGDGCEC